MKHWTIAVIALALAGCSGHGDTGDGSTGPDGQSGDATADGRAIGDGSLRDGTSTGDGGVSDTGGNQGDGASGMDVINPQGDSGSGGNDVVMPPVDSGLRDVVTPPTDSGGRDVITPPVDSGGGGDSGSGSCPISVSVTAPTMGQRLETCTNGGMHVYFDFHAHVTGGTASAVTFNWVTPWGESTAPPFDTRATGPGQVTFDGTSYIAHRQIGGAWTPGIDFPPLASYGMHNMAIAAGWHVNVTAQHASGCTATATQTFELIFTNRGCPNP